MNLLLKENELFLRLVCGEIRSEEISVPVNNSESGSHITIAAVFHMSNDWFEAKLVPEKTSPAQAKSAIIITEESLSGDCRVTLGGPGNTSAEDSSGQASALPQASAQPQTSSRPRASAQTRTSGGTAAQDINRQNLPVTAVWSQLAVFYMVPPEPEEIKDDRLTVEDKTENETEFTGLTEETAAGIETAESPERAESEPEAAENQTAAQQTGAQETMSAISENQTEPAEQDEADSAELQALFAGMNEQDPLYDTSENP
jgi:hypothetical protein